jgi:hypothetical protein
MAYITVEVDVDMDEFSDLEIENEYESRGLGLGTSINPDEQCQRAYTLHHQGRRDEAYAIMWELCLDRVNKII